VVDQAADRKVRLYQRANPPPARALLEAAAPAKKVPANHKPRAIFPVT